MKHRLVLGKDAKSGSIRAPAQFDFCHSLLGVSGQVISFAGSFTLHSIELMLTFVQRAQLDSSSLPR